METVYLICLIFGGFFLAVSIFAGTEADADFSLDVETVADLDTDVAGEGVVSAIQYLSFRNIIFFVAFFGLTGLILSKLGTPTMASFVVAAGLGVFSASLGHKAMIYLKKSEVGGSVNMRDLEGRTANVTVDVTKSKRGKISVSMKDRILQFLAIVADEASQEKFKFGDSVTIVKVEDNTAFVAESDFFQ